MFGYPLVNQHSYGKSPFFIGKSTINGHLQYLYIKLPEGTVGILQVQCQGHLNARSQRT